MTSASCKSECDAPSCRLNERGTGVKADGYRTEMKRLHDALSGMDLPDHRRRPSNNDGLRWLARCLHDRNSAHPMFDAAIASLKALGHEAVNPRGA